MLRHYCDNIYSVLFYNEKKSWLLYTFIGANYFSLQAQRRMHLKEF